MKIEILHVRDSDGGCEHAIYIDGRPVREAQVENVDPGRGYLRSDWDEHSEWVAGYAGYSQPFRDAIVAAREEADTTYIEED